MLDVKTHIMTFLTSILKCCEYMCFKAAISLIIKDNPSKFSEIIKKSQNSLYAPYFLFFKNVTDRFCRGVCHLYISLPILLSESDERRIDRCCAKEIIRSLLKHCLSRNRYFKNNDLTWTIFCPLCSVFMNKGSNSRLFACKLYLFRRLW